MNMRQVVLKNILQFSASSLVTALVGVPVSLASARLLGPYLLGVWSQVLLVQSYLANFHLGVWAGMNRELPLRRGMQDQGGARGVKDVTFSFVLPAAVLASLIGWVFSWMRGYEGDTRLAFHFLPVLVLSQYAETFFVMLLKSENRFDVISMAQVVRALSSIGVVGLLFFAHFDGYLWGYVATALLLVTYLARKSAYHPRLYWDTRTFRSLVRVGFVIMMIDLATTLFETSDRLVILSALGVTAFGQYNLGVRLGRLVSVACASIGPVLYPRMTEEYGRTRDSSSLARFVILPVTLASRIFPVALAGLVLVLPGVVHLLLSDYRPAIAAAQVYTYGLFFSIILDTSGYLLIALGRQVSYLAMLLVSAGGNLLLNWLLASLGLGLAGIALGATVVRACFAVVVIASSLKACGESDRRVARIIGRDLLWPAVLVAGVMFSIDSVVPVGRTWFEVGGMSAIRIAALLLGTFWLPLSALREFRAHRALGLIGLRQQS